MNILKKNNLISLGTNCKIKMFLNLHIDQPTHLFDWIGSPQWGINNLINDNYDLFNTSDYCSLNIYNSIDPLTIFCNKKYYFKFIHDLDNNTIIDKYNLVYNKHGDLIKVSKFLEFKEKYQRRIQRFIEMLNSNKSIVFLRLEELMANKIIYDNHKEFYAKPEIYYIKEFMNIIKNKYPNANFKLIFFSQTNQTELIDNLLIINDDLNVHDKNENEKLEMLINKNTDIINKLFQTS